MCEVLNATNFWFNHRKDLDYNFVVTCIYIHYIFLIYVGLVYFSSFKKQKTHKKLLKKPLQKTKKMKKKEKIK